MGKLTLNATVLTFQVRWADMDFNGHMKNTAYLDYAADSRMLFFKGNGFPLSDFMKLSIGPVVFKDTIQYFKELYMYDSFTVTLRLKGISSDGSKFHIVNDIRRSDGKPSALVTTEACWFDLKSRTITTPPGGLHELLKGLEKTEDYVEF